MGGASRQRFGKYELVSRLGAGGMAETWRAELVAGAGVRKQVVIKRILPWRAEEPGFVEMFVQEARLSAHLSHGNVAQVFDFGDVDGEYFIAMEFIDGLSLHEVLERAERAGFWHLPYPIAMLVAIDVCKGLHHAHSRTGRDGKKLGIVHRDISPDNLILSFEGETKVVDFGVAKARVAGRSETAPGLVKGKYSHFSPEQAVGDPLDGRSDIYALGIVLYEMLCGARPFEGSQLQVMRAIADGRYIPPLVANPDLIPELVQVLDRALEFRREERFSTALEMQEALSDVLFRHAPRAGAHWVHDFLAYLIEGSGKRVQETPLSTASRERIEGWKSSERPKAPARAATGGGAELAAADRPTQTIQRARGHAEGGESRRVGLVGVLLALFAVGAGVTLFMLSESDPTQMRKLPESVMVEKEPARPPVEEPAPPRRTEEVTQIVVRDDVRYSAPSPPVKFTLDEHHRVTVDGAAHLGSVEQPFRVERWPSIRKAAIPSTSLGVEEPREQPLFVAAIGQHSLGVRFATAEDRWPGARHVLFSVAARVPWIGSVADGAVRLSDGRVFTGGTHLGLDPTDLFAIQSFAEATAWRIEVVARDSKAPQVPALLYALPKPGTHQTVFFDGAPLNRDMAIVHPGGHTLVRADSGWFTQPTVTGLTPGALEITISVDSTAIIPPDPFGWMAVPCRSIISLPRVAAGTTVSAYRVVLANKTSFTFQAGNGVLGSSRMMDIPDALRICRQRGGTFTVRKRAPAERSRDEVKAGVVAYKVDADDLDFPDKAAR